MEMVRTCANGLTLQAGNSGLNKQKSNGSLAQLGERLPYKQNVSGSIPLAPTTKFSTSISRSAFFVCPSTSSKKYI